jgi:cytochrome b involved in lipid metabolism
MPNHFSSYFIQRFKTKVAHKPFKTFLRFSWISSVSYLYHHLILVYLHCLLGVLNSLPSTLLNLTVAQLPKRPQYSLKDVSAHCTENDCWMVIRDRVYDLTDFLREVCYIEH